MTYHVLNGDALVDRFLAAGLPGEVVVARECLIEGDMSGDTLEAFYHTRARYLAATYRADPKDYFDEVASEFEKLRRAPSPSEFNLWFGYDLFCRANMWFVLSLLQELPIDKEVFAVYPAYLQGQDVWQDFGSATPESLLFCYEKRLRFSARDLGLAHGLWQAYRSGDLAGLVELSRQPSTCFPYLEEVCRAHIERFATGGGKGRPEKAIETLLSGSDTSFPYVFKEFSRREGVYGFGDTQVKSIYDKEMQNRHGRV